MSQAPPTNAHPINDLLRSDRTIGLITSLIGEPAKHLQVERCWPIGEDGIRMQWSVSLKNEQRVNVFGCIDPNRHEALAKAARKSPEGGLWDPDTSMLLHLPETDPRLPQLAEALKPELMSEHLHPLTGGEIQSIELRGYKPARRATLVYQDTRKNCYIGKLFKSAADAHLIADRHSNLADALSADSTSGVTVPRVLTVIAPLNMVVFDAAPGRVPKPLSREKDLAKLLGTLSRLHRTELNGLPRFGIADEFKVIQRWTGIVSRLEPVLSQQTDAILERLKLLAQPDRMPTISLIHRDYYEKQLLLGQDGSTVLDLDTLAYGPAEIDLGNLLAHLLLAGNLQRKKADHRILLKKTQDHYPTADPTDLRLYTVTSLIRISFVHSFRDTSRHAVQPMLNVAEQLIEDIR
jgi:hypothetical protein